MHSTYCLIDYISFHFSLLWAAINTDFISHSDSIRREVRIVKHAFEIIYLLTDKNPIQVTFSASGSVPM